MRHSLRFALAVVACLVLGVPVSVSAAPVPWQAIDVMLHPEQSGGTMLISGELPESVPLPVEAELSVPAGTSILWIGEILGGPPADDPQLTYAKSTVGENDVYRFTLAKARTAQVEYAVSDAHTYDGATYTTSIRWVAGQDVPVLRVGVQLPQAARILEPAAEATAQVGPSGGLYYGKTVAPVKAGDVIDLGFTYSLPAGAAGATVSSSTAGGGNTLPIVLVAAAVMIGAFVLLAVRRTSGARRASAAEEVPGDDEARPLDTDADAEPTADADA